jgi:hypothetical protein
MMADEAIEHSDPRRPSTVVINWFAGNSCNYACSYCPPGLHDGSRPWPPAEVVLGFATRAIRHYALLGKRVHCEFTGGEITLWPELLSVGGALRTLGCSVGLMSNGSCSARQWKEIVDFSTTVTLTYHVESARLTHFLSIVETASARCRTHVNVPMKPERFDECLAIANEIATRCSDVTITLKPLLVDFGILLYPYTEAQLNLLRDYTPVAPLTRPLESIRGAMRVRSADGRSTVQTANALLAQGATSWSGWTCHAGLEMLSVDSRGRVFRAVCREAGMVGSVYDPEIALPSTPVTCTQARCACLADIMTTRYQTPTRPDGPS